jgi:hypothetical protein
MQKFTHQTMGGNATLEEWRQVMFTMPLHEWHGYKSEKEFEENFGHDDLVMSWSFCLDEVE